MSFHELLVLVDLLGTIKQSYKVTGHGFAHGCLIGTMNILFYMLLHIKQTQERHP